MICMMHKLSEIVTLIIWKQWKTFLSLGVILCISYISLSQAKHHVLHTQSMIMMTLTLKSLVTRPVMALSAGTIGAAASSIPRWFLSSHLWRVIIPFNSANWQWEMSQTPPALEQWRLEALLQYIDLTRGGAVLLQVRLPPSPHLPNPALLVRAATSLPRRRTANWLDAHNKPSPQDFFSSPIWDTRGGSASVNTAESRAFLNWGCFKFDSAQQTTWVLCECVACDCVCARVFECVFGGEWRREGRAPIWNACVCASCVTVSLSLSPRSFSLFLALSLTDQGLDFSPVWTTLRLWSTFP